MKQNAFTVITMLFGLALANLEAQESPEQIVKRLAEIGEGVQEVKVENGKLKSLKVVGQERISAVLGQPKGLQLAQKRATLKANAAFIEWMKTNVASVSSLDDETIVTMTGDGQNVSEQGKSSEAMRQQVATAAEGLVRGLSLVAKDQDPDTKMLTLIFSWSPEKAALASEAQTANEKPTSATPSTPNSSGEIPRKTVVSPDFDN
jgi:hypothetical protein